MGGKYLIGGNFSSREWEILTEEKYFRDGGNGNNGIMDIMKGY